MKKELVIPEPWKHHAIQACVSSIDMHFYVDVLALTQAEDGAIEINIVLLPNNRLGFAIKQGENWHHYENLDALAESACGIEIIQHVYFGLFKLWKCLTPSKARKMVLRNILYQQSIGDKESNMYFDRLVYVTGHLYRFVQRLLQKESPNWSVIAEPIISGEMSSKTQPNLDKLEL